MGRSVEQYSSAATLGKDTTWMGDPESRLVTWKISAWWHIFDSSKNCHWALEICRQFSDFPSRLAKIEEVGLHQQNHEGPVKPLAWCVRVRDSNPCLQHKRASSSHYAHLFLYLHCKALNAALPCLRAMLLFETLSTEHWITKLYPILDLYETYLV